MDLSNPANALVPTLDAAVVSVLAGTNRPLTGREVARLSRSGTQPGIQRVLNRMADAGLVNATEAGPARLYTLNRDHVAARAALALVDLRGQLFARIREALADWTVQPAAAAVFGSAARGDGDFHSDIDLLVVRPEDIGIEDPIWSASVDDLARHIQRWSGNPASIIQLTPHEVADMVARGEPIVDELEHDAVPLTPSGVLEVATRGQKR